MTDDPVALYGRVIHPRDMLPPLHRDKTLEEDVSAKLITSREYQDGLIWRYTHRAAFRHFISRHARFSRHLRLLFAELEALSREDVIYRGTNGLATATKASQLLERYPERTFYEYRFARRVSHTDAVPPPTNMLTSQQSEEWIAYLRDVHSPKWWVAAGYVSTRYQSAWAIRRLADLRQRLPNQV